MPNVKVSVPFQIQQDEALNPRLRFSRIGEKHPEQVNQRHSFRS